ncbi:MFS transporter [Caballeronia sp. LZ065]|uniref:MFS transporter n=1 Tax=Caballeronia sp. LZ065 TaxID=3038571 RepID=UPI00285CD38F|nr:MFS transporter [Caballeronia sp. LZ065]MDR5781256.1 MFS transporter [Caballeronia sp. LZ065]
MRLNRVVLLMILLCSAYFIAFIDRVNIGMASTAFGPEFGLTKTQIGTAASAFGWSYVFSQIFGSLIGDRLGARRTLAICGLIVAAATAYIGFATGLTGIVLARLVLGVGEGAMFPVASRAIAQSLPREMFARAQGLTHAFGRLANAVTPGIIGALIVAGSWRMSFWVIAAVSALWAVGWFVAYRDPAPGEGEREAARRAAAAPSGPVPWSLLVRRIGPMSLVYFCYGWVFYLFLGWIPQYFVHSQGLDIGHSAIFSSGVFFAGVAGDLAGGTLSDALYKRTGSLAIARRYVISGALLCALLCMVPMLTATDTTVIALCLSGALFFCELIVGPIWALPTDILPRYASTGTGMMSAGATIAGIVSPIVAGMLIDRTGNWSLPFFAAIGVLALGSVFALFIRTGEEPASAVVSTPG